jgi:CIC family chloride channel protein
MRKWMGRILELIAPQASGRWLILAGGVGLLCGAVGFLFNLGVNLVTHLALGRIVGYQPLLHGAHVPIAPADHIWPWLAVPVVAAGGCLAGWIAQRWAPAAAGGGTDLAVEAWHRHRADIPLRTTLTKLATAFATLGSGGSAGREGPITLVGAGFGSWFAQRLGLTVRDRRTLLVAGIAGGIAAVFHTPLAAALFAAEVLYRGRDIEAESLIPAAIASVIAFVSASLLEGTWNALVGAPAQLTTSLFQVPTGLGFSATAWPQLVGYLLVALACAVAARAWIGLMSGTALAARRSGLPLWLRAGIGGALAGTVAVVALLAVQRTTDGQVGQAGFAVLGPGYALLQQVFDQADGWSWAMALLLVAVAKMTATACTVASGGSGGLFAPSLVIGGCLGGATGILMSGTSLAAPVPACVVVGMGAFLAAGHRVPVTALLLVCELSGTYGLLIPAMWTCGLAVLLTGERTLIPGQQRSAAESPAHRERQVRDLFADARVSDLMTSDQVRMLEPSSTLDDCRTVLADSGQTVFPVVDAQRKLVGLVTLDDLRAFLDEDAADDLVRVADLMAGRALALRPDDVLSRALRRFAEHPVGELPVVDDAGVLIGLLRRDALFRWYAARMERHAGELRAEGVEPGTGSWRRSTSMRS